MHILIAAAGSWRRAPEKALFDTYLARLPWRVELQEIEIKPKGDAGKDRKAEGEKLLSAAEHFRAQHLIALDEKGRNLTSRVLADMLADWQDGGENRVAFIIGGHHGLDARVLQKAHLLLSFGQMTWPHLLARPLLAEQLYRAHTVISGHPYHRD